MATGPLQDTLASRLQRESGLGLCHEGLNSIDRRFFMRAVAGGTGQVRELNAIILFFAAAK